MELITLLAREHDVLIAETAHPAILRVDYQGNLLDPFGDANFLAEMAQQRAKRDQYFYYRILGISALFIFLAIIVGSLILLRDRRLREIAAQDPALG